jgi:site-specific recombinase XerD
MTSVPNDELRHEWRQDLQLKRGLKKSTIGAKLAALTAYEVFTSNRSFLKLDREQVAAFKEHLLETPSSTTGQRLSPSYIVHTLDHCSDFFEWLAEQKSGRNLDRGAISWFSASRADKARARAAEPRAIPAFDEGLAAFGAMPAGTLRERRNRAVFSLLLLTSIRADALASLPLGSVDLKKSKIWQDGRVVRTKNSKSFNAYFLGLAPEAGNAFVEWVSELRGLGLSAKDALFPRDTELIHLEDDQTLSPGSFPTWSGTSQIRAIIRNAFKAAGLAPHAVHVMRHMLTRHVFSLRPSAEEIIAWSMNLGHAHLETTFESYARPDEDRRAELIAGIGQNSSPLNTADLDALALKLIQLDPEKAAKIFASLGGRHF